MNTMNYKDVMTLGFKKHTAQSIIKQAKVYMINQGFDFYKNNRCGVVPSHAISKVLGINLEEVNNE